MLTEAIFSFHPSQMEKINKNQLLRQVTVHLGASATAGGSQLPDRLVADGLRPADHAWGVGDKGWGGIHHQKDA